MAVRDASDENPYANSAPFSPRNSPFSSPRFSPRRSWYSSTPYYHGRPHRNDSDKSPFSVNLSSPEHQISPNTSHSDYIPLRFGDGDNCPGMKTPDHFAHGRRRRSGNYYPRWPSNRKSHESPRTYSDDNNPGHQTDIRFYVPANCLKDPWEELTKTPSKSEIQTETSKVGIQTETSKVGIQMETSKVDSQMETSKVDSQMETSKVDSQMETSKVEALPDETFDDERLLEETELDPSETEKLQEIKHDV